MDVKGLGDGRGSRRYHHTLSVYPKDIKKTHSAHNLFHPTPPKSQHDTSQPTPTYQNSTTMHKKYIFYLPLIAHISEKHYLCGRLVIVVITQCFRGFRWV